MILLGTEMNMKIEMKKLFKIILCTINYHCGHISADYETMTMAPIWSAKRRKFKSLNMKIYDDCC